VRHVTSLGSFHPDKDQLQQIEIARRMPDWTLTLLGSPAAPRYARKVQREADRTPNVEVVLNPTKERIEQELSRSSHFLHSNPHEGFGIAVVEAAAAGCIPVVPDTGGVREIVESEELRFGDVDGCVAALRASTGEAGRRLLADVQRGLRRFRTESFRSAMAGAIGASWESDHATQDASAAN
jgi:glycosyltransferase involved in cell wall biosynthesis